MNSAGRDQVNHQTNQARPAASAAGTNGDGAAAGKPEIGNKAERRVNERRLAPGEFVFNEGDRGDFAYVVVTGMVAICKLTGGEYVTLVELGEGSLFGEMALIDRSPRSAGAMAKTDVVVREVDEKALMAYIKKTPATAIDMMKRLASYVRSTNKELEVSVFDTVDGDGDNDAEAAPVVPPQQEAGKKRSPMQRLFGGQRDQEHIIYEFQAPSEEIEKRRLPPLVMTTFFAILLFVATAVIWASLSVIDTTLSARGKLTTTVPKIAVQAGDSSVIKSIHVEPGKLVRKGDILATLDPTFTESDFTKASMEYDRLRSLVERLEAESNGAGKEAADRISDELQQAIFLNRLEEYRSRIVSMDLRIDGLVGNLANAREDIKLARIQLETLKQIEDGNKALSQLGSIASVSHFSYLNAKNSRLDVERSTRSLEQSIGSIDGEIDALRSDRQAFVSGWHSSIGKELAEASKQLEAKHEDIIKIRRKRENITILAPADGIVLELEKLFVGAIVSEGEEILTLVPVDVPLTVEMDIDPRDISNLFLGAGLSIKLDALPFQKHNDLEGELTFISEDTVEESIQGENGTFYRARATITANNLEDVPGNFSLVPGMLLTGDIRVGRRRLITYFIYPVIRTIQTSFTEPGK